MSTVNYRPSYSNFPSWIGGVAAALKKWPRSLTAADGVVDQQITQWLDPPPRPRLSKERDLFFDGAATPPVQEGKFE